MWNESDLKSSRNEKSRNLKWPRVDNEIDLKKKKNELSALILLIRLNVCVMQSVKRKCNMIVSKASQKQVMLTQEYIV